MTLNQLVRRVYRRYPQTLASYNALVLHAWKEAGWPVPDELIALADQLPNVETLRRQGARIRNQAHPSQS